MSLLDRVNEVGNSKAIEIDGLTFHIKTKNVMEKAQFQDALAASAGETEVESLKNLATILSVEVKKIDGVDDVKKFLLKVPEMNDLISIGFIVGSEMTEKESKNFYSPSESLTSTADAPKPAKKAKQRARTTKEK